MTSVLLTAFEPYDRWKTNASQLCIDAITAPENVQLTTRVYPVEFAAVKKLLRRDLKKGYDYALHLGQAPGTGRIRFEAIGLNIGGEIKESPEQFRSLAKDGPVAYQSALPMAKWVARLREAGIPAYLSYHAGTYLCNATLYWTHYLAEKLGLATKAGFIHLPFETSQVLSLDTDYASMPAGMTARAIGIMLRDLGG